MRTIAAGQTDHPGRGCCCINLSQAFMRGQTFQKWTLEKCMNFSKPQLSKAAFLFQPIGLDCQCMCEWMSAFVFLHEKPKRAHTWNQGFNPARNPYYTVKRPHDPCLWFPPQKRRFRDKVFLLKTLCIWQTAELAQKDARSQLVNGPLA